MQFEACPTSSVAVRNPGSKTSACFSPPGVRMAIFLRFSFASCTTGYAKEGVLVVRCGPEKSFFYLLHTAKFPTNVQSANITARIDDGLHCIINNRLMVF